MCSVEVTVPYLENAHRAVKLSLDLPTLAFVGVPWQIRHCPHSTQFNTPMTTLAQETHTAGLLVE